MDFTIFNNKKVLNSLEQGIPQKKESLQALWRLIRLMLSNLEFEDVSEKVVNSILDELGYLKLGYRIIVLALINKTTGHLERIAISQTAEAKKALALTPVPFKDIRIPLSDTENLSIRALENRTIYRTRNWYDILRPVYTPEQATIIQQAVGIKASMVFPLMFGPEPTGILIFSMNKDYEQVTEEENDLLNGFVDLVGLTVQNSILYTSLRTTTSQLREANEKLKELDQLKDDFVSIASHELRTPMTAIRSYSWMALNKSDVPLSEKLKKYLARTLTSTERLINLVNDMLNISRIESGRIEIMPQSFDIGVLIGDVIAEVDAKAKEKNLSIHILHTEVPKVFADPDKIHQILLNLIGNSLKFTPNGGEITISLFSDGKSVEVSIKDSGMGIALEDMSRLFKKFGRLDNSYVAAATSGGTGLGLYICKSLIELMKGKIWAKSDGAGKGATFIFSLPAATEDVIKQSEHFTLRPASGEAKALEPVAI